MRLKRLIKENFNMEGMGSVTVNWDFDEEEFQESGYDNLLDYIKDNVTFEVEYFDNETYHHAGFDNAFYDEIESEVGEDMMQSIISDLQESGESTFETNDIYNASDFDANSPQELNNVAMRILNHGEYFRGCRGFILTNGVVVYTEAEHNMVSQIKGIDNTFDFIRKGNIRVLDQSIDLSKPPTQEQRAVLRQVISAYSDDELYVDIMTDNGTASAHYYHPDWRYVLGEIDRYFEEGIKPGGKLTESMERGFDNIQFVGWPDSMTLRINDENVAKYDYKDTKARPFEIFRDKLYIGDKGGTHGQLDIDIPGRRRSDDPHVDGRIWMGAKTYKFNYAVVCFWGTRQDGNFKPYIEELAQKLNVDPNKIVVVVDVDFNQLAISKPMLLSDWNGTIHQLTHQEEEVKNLHMMDAQTKRENTDEFRKARDEKLAKKLTNDKGEEMPMAKYHNMIYQESKKIMVTEEQYNRLFRGRKNILMTEEQYKRLFVN